MLPQAGAVRDGVRDVALVEGPGEERGREGAQGVHGDVFAAVGGPLSGHGGAVHLVAVFGLGGRVQGDDAGGAVAGAVPVQDCCVGLSVYVGHLAVGTWDTYINYWAVM